MKNHLLVTSCLAAALLAGCRRSPDQPADPKTGTALAPGDQVPAMTRDVDQRVQDFTFAQKAEFIAHTRAQLAGLNRSLDEFSATIGKSSDAVKAGAMPMLAALREQSALLDQWIAQIAEATPATWSRIKADSETACDALKDGLAQARQWVSAGLES